MAAVPVEPQSSEEGAQPSFPWVKKNLILVVQRQGRDMKKMRYFLVLLVAVAALLTHLCLVCLLPASTEDTSKEMDLGDGLAARVAYGGGEFSTSRAAKKR